MLRTVSVFLAFIALSVVFAGVTGTATVDSDVPTQDLRVQGQGEMRYFLIGVEQGAKVPDSGYSLLIVMPGGDGGPDFLSFVKSIWKNALPEGYLVAQLVAVKWSPGQEIIWPAAKDDVPGARFATEEFVEAVIKDIGARHKLNADRVFTLSWSSSGRTAYAVALQEKTAVRGSFVAMSVWHPQIVPSLANAKGRPFYIYHSPNDKTCPIFLARKASSELRSHGRIVQLVEYGGGHGWTSGRPFDDIRAGVDWLEDQVDGQHKRRDKTAPPDKAEG